jgi:hypothetical protein
VIRGGLRTRLVVDSVRFAVLSTLQQYGWFDATIWDKPPGLRRHKPFHYIARPFNWSENVEPNAIAVSPEDIFDEALAFGGDVEDILELYIDIFAEDDAVGWQVAYDIRDSFIGKNPTLGMLGPQIDIYDFRLATPAPFTTVDVETIRVDRSQGDAREWHRHWFIINVTLTDDYDDEANAVFPLTRDWSSADRQTWTRIQEVQEHVP